MKQPEPTVATGAAIDEAGLTVAVVKIDLQGVAFCWLPELFTQPLCDEVREALVTKLREHANKLESKELDGRMRVFAAINQPPHRA